MVSVVLSPSGSVAPESVTTAKWWFGGHSSFGLTVTPVHTGGRLGGLVGDGDGDGFVGEGDGDGFVGEGVGEVPVFGVPKAKAAFTCVNATAASAAPAVM